MCFANTKRCFDPKKGGVTKKSIKIVVVSIVNQYEMTERTTTTTTEGWFQFRNHLSHTHNSSNQVRTKMYNETQWKHRKKVTTKRVFTLNHLVFIICPKLYCPTGLPHINALKRHMNSKYVTSFDGNNLSTVKTKTLQNGSTNVYTDTNFVSLPFMCVGERI